MSTLAKESNSVKYLLVTEYTVRWRGKGIQEELEKPGDATPSVAISSDIIAWLRSHLTKEMKSGCCDVERASRYIVVAPGTIYTDIHMQARDNPAVFRSGKSLALRHSTLKVSLFTRSSFLLPGDKLCEAR
ncbi:hypothetical protein CBL_01351 [Carabus blaptoides fortunei]